MIIFGPYTITLGMTDPIALPGTPQALMAIRLYNFSPYTLVVQLAGQSTVIPAECRDIIEINPNWQWDGTLQVTPANDLNLASPVSFVLRIVGFGAGEPIPGVDPTDLSHTIGGQVSNVIATEIVNNGAAPGTTIVSSSDNNANDGSNSINNDGSRITKLNHNGVSTAVERLVNGSGGGLPTPAVVTYGDPSDLTVATYNGVGNFGNLTLGNLVNAGGVATVGVWAVVQSQPGLHVTATGNTGILSFSAPVSGRYRVNWHFETSQASTITFSVGFTTEFLSVAHTKYAMTQNATALAVLNAFASLPGGDYPCCTMEFTAGIGSTITVSYNNATATPNDWVTADVEVAVA